MVNINKLRGKIVEKGMSVEELAKRINMDKSTLYRKLGKSGDSFLIKEADKIVEALELDREEAINIFFAQYVA